jgi:hypothetical protein
MIHTDEDDEFARIERENSMKGQPYNWETNAIQAAIRMEREACAGLRKEVELQGKRSTEYEDGFWDGVGKYEDLIRARGKHDTR